MLTKGHFSPNELVFKEKPRVPLSFHLELTRTPTQQCLRQFCADLPHHSHYSFQDQNPTVQPHLRKIITTHLLTIERNMLYVYSQQYLTTKEGNESQSQINQRFGKAYPLQIGTFVLHRNFKINPKFS